jgi:hypothetical protein
VEGIEQGVMLADCVGVTIQLGIVFRSSHMFLHRIILCVLIVGVLVVTGCTSTATSIVARGDAVVEEVPEDGFGFENVKIEVKGITMTVSGDLQRLDAADESGSNGHVRIRVEGEDAQVIASANLPYMGARQSKQVFQFLAPEPHHDYDEINVRVVQHIGDSPVVFGSVEKSAVEGNASQDYEFEKLKVDSKDGLLTVSGVLIHAHGKAPHPHHGHMHITVLNTSGDVFASASVPYRRKANNSPYFEFLATLSGVDGGIVRVDQHVGSMHDANTEIE